MSNLLTLDRLIVNQKAKLIEVTQEYAIRDENGDQVGYIRQEGQSTLHKAARFITSIDQFLTHHFALYDDAGTKILELSRPAKFVKSRIVVKDGNGQQLGQIVQKNVFGKIRFDLEASNGELVGRYARGELARLELRDRWIRTSARLPGSRRSSWASQRRSSLRRTTTSSTSTIPSRV